MRCLPGIQSWIDFMGLGVIEKYLVVIKKDMNGNLSVRLLWT